MDFSKVRNIIFFSSLAAITVLFLYIVKPLFYPIFWAAVIASISYPLYEKLKNKIKLPNLSAVIILLLTIFIVFVPLALLGSLLVKESIDLYSEIGQRGSRINSSIETTVNWVKHNPVTSKLNIDESFWVEKISQTASSVTGFIFKSLKSLTENSVTFLVGFVIMLYALFYFIRDGKKMLQHAMHISPLGDRNEVKFYNKFTSTARAAIKGTLVIGLVQGTLGSLLFLVIGLKGALIWGLLMMVFSVLIGSYFVWVPIGIIMLVVGNIWQGVLILSVGTLIISTIDNLIRPVLIGRDIQMHPLLIFLSTLGGVIAFGLSGFVIGPVVTSLLIAFWEIYESYFKKDLGSNHS